MSCKTAIVAALLVSFLSASCATMVNFETNAQEAQLRINGRGYGSTPQQVPLSNFVFRSYQVSIDAPGYVPYRGPLKKEVKVLPIVFSFVSLLPLLWVYGPQPDQYFTLERLDPALLVAAPAAARAAVPAPGRSVSVLEFNIAQGAETGGLTGKDLALLMETYLSSSGRIELKDRLYLRELIQEKELQSTDLFDPGFISNLGSLTGPRNLLIGQTVKMGNGISVFVKVIDLEMGTQSRVFERSDIFISSRGVDSLKVALKEVSDEVLDYYGLR